MLDSYFLLSPSYFRKICEHSFFKDAATPSGLLRLRERDRKRERENPDLVVHGFL
jgi:hypothetical protein